MSEALARVAREILLAAVRAADPGVLTARAVERWSAGRPRGDVWIVAMGKAAVAMTQGASAALGDAPAGGVVVAPSLPPELPRGIRAFAGGHPMPNAEGSRGAAAIEALLGSLPAGARVLALISGGASALTTYPSDGILLEDLTAVSAALMAAGAGIRELNCVRKHLDRLKGGRMALAARHAMTHALILSDVIGDPLDVIASGPLSPDPTTYADAIAVLESRGAWRAAPARVREHLEAGARGERPETPKAEDPCFARVTIEIVANNALAVDAARAEAEGRGFDVERLATPIDGEARDAGAWFAGRVLEARARGAGARARCIVGGGETTVTVAGGGLGGRNLEFAAAAALAIDGIQGVAIGSIGTDGLDGPTGAAGAVVDGDSVAHAAGAGVNVAARLRDNDSLRALDAAGAVVRTGATGTNVMDVAVGLIAAS